MARGQLSTRLIVHACPSSAIPQIPLVLNWSPQPLRPDFHRGTANFRLAISEAEDLVAELAKVPECSFELIQSGTETGTLFMFLPSLGIYRGEINRSGSLVLSEDRIQLMLEQAAGNHREFTRLMRLALGQAWDDLLEPFRAVQHSANVVLLTKAG